MAWRVAESLQQLLRQLNTLAPKRSKASDGSIGDAAHASRSSDHNPWFQIAGQSVVTARDFTHDPANGMDCNKLAEALVKSKDPRIKYIIWNKRILDSRPGNNPWKWMPYSGSNPHTKHLHLSVVASAQADSPASWSLPGLTAPTPEPVPQEVPDVSSQYEKDSRARWPKEDALEKDLRGDLNNKRIQMDRIEAALVELTKKVDALAEKAP